MSYMQNEMSAAGIQELSMDEIDEVNGAFWGLSRAVSAALIVVGVGTGTALVVGIAVGIAVAYAESQD
jgi:hypothetical protein